MTDTNVYADPESATAAASPTPPAHPTTATSAGTALASAAPLTQADTTTSPTPTPTPRPKDPRIASLHALFPDYDDLILYSVLDSVNGDQDRAIDALLGMSDPEYKGGAHATEDGVVHGAGLTQTELDEQFARRLVLEEEDAQQAAWIAQEEEARMAQTFARGAQQRPQPQQGDTVAEQFGKFAETGKKTFTTFFNKVKAKIHEMEQSKTPTYTYDPSQYEQRTSEHQAVPYATRPRTQAPAPAQQPAYYDPSPRAASPPVQGYDATREPKFEGATTPPNAPAPAGTSPPPSNTQWRPLTSPPIDGGKYGLLPKRPVTLLRPAESTQLQRQHSLDDSDDGLEYAESPFEEAKK